MLPSCRIVDYLPTISITISEKSLGATKDVVRKKLGLGPKVSIELVQVRENTKIDLEDGALSFICIRITPTELCLIES